MPSKRESYSADYKLQVVKYAAENGNRAAERKFGMSEKLVRDWRKAEVTLAAMKKTKKANRGLKARWPQLEERVRTWALERGAAGRGLSTMQLRLHAQVVAKEMNINDFAGGPSWCYRFMQRNRLSIRARTTMSQKLPADFQVKVDSFREFVEKHVTEHSVTPDHIINMDEVPIAFDIPMGRSVAEKGLKSVNIVATGHEKSHFTVVLACCGDGSKLPPMVIFKRKTTPEIQSPSVAVAVNEKGWMDQEMMNLWLKKCYTKRRDGIFRTRKALLVMDSTREHITPQFKDKLKVFNSIPAIIPGGLTKILQPLEISVNRSFKAVLHNLWEQWMMDGEHSFTATGRRRHATFLEVIGWIDKAWASVTTETILSGFRNAGIIGPATDDESAKSNAEEEAALRPPPELFRSDAKDEEFSGFSDFEIQDPEEEDAFISEHKPAALSAPMDSQASPQPVMCEVCGTYFETRRGLSSHARLHLRKLGVTVSESSGAPIELLYQITRERYGSLPDLNSDSFLHVSVPQKMTLQQEPEAPSEEEDTSTSYKTGVKLVTAPQMVDHQGSPADLNDSSASALPSTPPPVKPAEGSGSSSSEHTATAKPLWAPRETDAPITLASDPSDEVYVCELCGCWYETRKGLASHARAHLRQIGISDSDVKGSPIDLLYQIMEEEDLKPVVLEKKEELTSSSPPGSSSKRPSPQSPSPESSSSKRPKLSEECTCILCGEEFENRKGLASHARSHLRHIGMSELVGKNSAIDAVQDLVSSGMLEAVHPPKTNNATSSSAAPSPAPPFPDVPAQSSGPSQSWTPFSSTPLSTSPEKTFQSPQTPVNRAPKAKKGFRLAVDPLHRKPKPEPVETEVSVQLKASTSESSSTVQNLTAAVVSAKPSQSGVQSPPTVLCEFCGQLFDTRKALSCHARAHLRQLGLSWSIKTSPIDLLKEVMMHGEEGRKEVGLGGSAASGKVSWSSQGSRRSLDSLASRETASNSPLDYSMKEKSSFSKSGVIHLDTSCELCGFDFENRKALASHARAHLRQLGIIEWKADGATSPIELLSELIKRDPAKVSEITKRYRMGDLYIKKSQRTAPSPSPSQSTDSDSVVASSLKSSMQHHEHRASRKDHSNHSVRSSRGVHSQKHGAPTGRENQNSNSQQPSRSGSIPALLPKPPLTPLVKLVGKIYSLKCRFCDEVFQGPLSVQEQWITHLQKHILSLGYKDKASPPATPVTTPALVHPVAV